LAGKSNNQLIFSLSHKYKHPAIAGLSFLLILCSFLAAAQKADTSNKLPIEILPSSGTRLEYITTDSGAINKLINNVSLKQGETFMYCDSAYITLEKNNVQAFGNVKIVQPGGTQVESDYLRYTGNTKKAYLSGNVSLTDGKNNLWSEELEYDLGSKTGVYTQGGTLQSEATTLSSNAGTYNVRTKDARFTGEVFVTDPQYNVTSVDLGYNTETKVVRFFGESVVINDKSELRTSNGTWDAKNEIAHFTTRSSIQNEAQYIEGDRMDYNRKTGFGVATGNVYALDTGQHITLYCGYAQYNEKTRQLWATIRPVMKQANKEDSIYMRADTFYAAPVPKAEDTLKMQKAKGKIQNEKLKSQKNIGKNTLEMTEVAVTDSTTAADSTRPRYFIGYHNVLVYSDSLQARCDSISYSQADSTMRLMYNPIAWSRRSQITGDTILLFMDSSKLRKLYVPNNAFIVSLAGPEKANLYDQVQGKTITGYFENNNIREMVIWPNAEAIQYSKDESGAYLGMNQAQSERIRVFFDSSQVNTIVLEQEVKQTMTPMQKVNFAAARLSRFQWRPDKRPKSIQELFLYDPLGIGAKKEDAATDKKEEKTKSGKSKKKRK